MRQMIGAILSLMLVVTGCAATQEAKSVEKSGFLGDYSLLKEGERSTIKEGAEDQALLVYKNPAADWRKYRKVQLDPVTVWMSQKDSQLKDVSVEDRQRLAATLWSKLDESLRKDYEMTSQPGPDVVRIQVAITEAGIIQCCVGYGDEHHPADTSALGHEEPCDRGVGCSRAVRAWRSK